MSSARLEIRVIDATRDAAAEGLRIDLHRLGRGAAKLCSGCVDASGRLRDPALASALAGGEYEAVFHVAEFYRARGVTLPPTPFLDSVPFRFGIPRGEATCALPVRVSPWSFSVSLDNLVQDFRVYDH